MKEIKEFDFVKIVHLARNKRAFFASVRFGDNVFIVPTNRPARRFLNSNTVKTLLKTK